MNSVILMGRLTKDPVETRTRNGICCVSFSLAVDRSLSREKREEAEKKGQPTADFIRVVTWGDVAENCLRFTGKGKRVLVSGSIQTGSYEDATTRERRYTVDVFGRSVQFLDWKESSASASTSADIADYTSIDDDRIPF